MSEQVLERAIELHKGGQLREASALYEQILEAEPGNARVWSMLAQIWSSRLLFGRAEQCLRRAIEHEPGQFLYHAFLAAALRRQGRWDEAIASIEEAIRLRPDHPDLHVDLITMLDAMGRDAGEARERFRRVLPSDPSELDRRSEAMAGLASRRRAALALLERACELDDTSAARWERRGRLALDLGRLDEARACFERALALDEACPDAWAGLVTVSERQGDLDGARWYASGAVQKRPDDIDLQIALARLDRRQGDVPAALARLSRLRSEAKTTSRWTWATILTELGWTLDALGRYNEALGCFQEAQQTARERKAAQRHPIGAMRLWLEGVRERVGNLTPEQWSHPGDDEPGPILLVSFPRGAGSMLERLLSAHPRLKSLGGQAVMSETLRQAHLMAGSDVPYPTVLETLDDEQIVELRRFYRRRAQELGVGDGLIALDTRRMNLTLLGITTRLFPNARVVADLMDPRNAVLNAYFELFPPDPVTVHLHTVEDAAALYEQVMGLFLAASERLGIPVLRVHERRWQEDARETAHEVLSFLGLEADMGVLSTVGLAPRAAGSPAPVPPPAHQEARWEHYPQVLDGVLGRLQPFIERFKQESA